MSRNPPGVLICDDAEFARRVIADVLVRAGYRVVGEAESGPDAIEQYRQLRPDVVTMDLVMPELGGIDVVRAIMGLDPNARIVMCSAMGQQPLIAEALAAGAREFVVKPFHPSRILEAVGRVLG